MIRPVALTAILFALGQAALFAGPPSSALAQQRPVTGPETPGMESYDRLVPDFMEKWGLPGGAVAVVKDGRLVFSRGYGYADVERREPVDPQSHFRFASVSKPITAVAVLRLVEQGKLDLNAKVCDVLGQQPHPPQADARWHNITLLQLLHHTGGWDRNKAFDPMFRSLKAAEVVGAQPPASSQTVIRYMLGESLQFDPGHSYAYSNFGYCLLGRVIEAKTGRNYEESVRELVLKPCGIERMKIGHTQLKERSPGEVRYYTQPADATAESVFPASKARVPVPYGGFYLEAMDSHGAWIGSAVDLVRFVVAVEGRHHTPLLTPASLALMTSRPDPPVSVDKPSYYGLGWSIRPIGDNANWWHNGSLPGTSTLLVRTSRGVAWAVLFNSRPDEKSKPDRGNFGSELDKLMWKAMKEVDRWPEQNLFDEE